MPSSETFSRPESAARRGRFRAANPETAAGDPTRPSHRPRRIGRLLSYYRPHWRLLLADLAAAILVSATALALPLVANHVTTRLVANPDPNAALVEIATTAGAMLLLLAAQALAIFFVDYRGHVMGARIEAEVRRELFAHCQTLAFDFHDNERVGRLMSRITNDSLWLGELFHHAPEDLAIGLLKFFGALAILAFIDPLLALAIGALVPVAVAYAIHFNGRMNRALARSRTEIANVNARVEDSLAGIRVVQSFAHEDIEIRRFDAENRRFLESRADGYRSEAWFSVGSSTFATLVVIIVIALGAARVVTAGLTVADMLTMLLLAGVLVDPVNRLANVVRLWQEGYTGFEHAMELLDVAPAITDAPGARPLGAVTGAIAFEGVSFRYGADGPLVLDNLSLAIRPGEFVALVGPSGVGKSTLAALIPRFYEPVAGRITIDGMDIRAAGLSSLRRSIGMVQQDVYLFGGTIAENVRYGRPDATDAEIEAAARAAHAHGFIMALPDGYASEIGQRGIKLSGGQKQRLTIARAFLKNSPILVFDEATSALDTASERAVQAALFDLAKGRTTLVIAHRLSTVRHADRIIVMGPGGIIEEGRHEALIARGGSYAALFEAQARI